MIKILIIRNQLGNISGYKVKGHANFDAYGKDIVCSAVSATTQMITNGLMEIVGVHLTIRKLEGLMDCHLPDHLPIRKREDANVLLETMLLSLQNISLDYPHYISIEERKVE